MADGTRNGESDPKKGSPGEDHEVDYVVRKYGLTRDQARGIVKEHMGDRDKIDAAAGNMKAHRR